jgi:extradiol dioxygenase family protein
MNANFHLSLPCKDIKKTREFYSEILKTKLGRSTNSWIDIDLFGNQITFTKSGDFNFEFKNYRLGEQILPSFHFGIIINIDEFGKLYSRLLQLDIGTTIKTTFMEDSIGEHLSFFIKDPNDYMIEFKCFKVSSETFESQKK